MSGLCDAALAIQEQDVQVAGRRIGPSRPILPVRAGQRTQRQPHGFAGGRPHGAIAELRRGHRRRRAGRLRSGAPADGGCRPDRGAPRSRTRLSAPSRPPGQTALRDPLTIAPDIARLGLSRRGPARRPAALPRPGPRRRRHFDDQRLRLAARLGGRLRRLGRARQSRLGVRRPASLFSTCRKPIPSAVRCTASTAPCRSDASRKPT